MNLPYGKIEGNALRMEFSTADYCIASVIAAIREHLDVIEEMEVVFLGASTEVVSGPQPVFQPVPVVVHFEYRGKEKAEDVLRRAYEIVWHGVVSTFPDESKWSESKAAYAEFISAQADLLMVRLEALKEE